MILIRSNDVNSGYSYNGNFDLNSSLLGTYYLKYHWVEDGDVPWIYSGYNVLSVKRNSTGSSSMIYFEKNSSDDTESIREFLQTTFSQLSYGNVSVTYSDTTGLHTMTFSEAVTLQWSSDYSSAKEIFGVYSDISGTGFNLDMSFINLRPKFLQVHIDQTTSSSATSSIDRPTLLLPLYDDLCLGQQITYDSDNTTDSLNITFYRLGLTDGPVPIDLEWVLCFSSNA
jgi:hypothetical protein